MTPFKHPFTDTVLTAPQGWDEQADGTCMDLHVAAADGVMFSYWRPSWRERLSLIFGGHIRLGVFASGHPPVSLDTI